MLTDSNSYEQLIERFTAWAGQEENVRAAIIIGSRARTDHPADEWSDLDIIVLARAPAVYWQTSAWLTAVGTPWLRCRFLEEWADPRAITVLSTTFAHYDEEDVWQALLATMDLFAWLERETAVALHATYPTECQSHTTELVHKLFTGR